MALEKSVTLTVVARSESFNGTDAVIEVVLQETNPDPTSAPISVVFRSLNKIDAAVFVTGSDVAMTVQTVIVKQAADPAPPAVATPSLLDRALGAIGLQVTP